MKVGDIVRYKENIRGTWIYELGLYVVTHINKNGYADVKPFNFKKTSPGRVIICGPVEMFDVVNRYRSKLWKTLNKG